MEQAPWQELRGKRIFFAVLDWGLGHSTRSSALLHLLRKQNEVVLGLSSANRNFFEKEFPDVQQVELPSYEIRYSRFFPLWIRLLLDWPRIRRVIHIEHKILHQLLSNERFDLVISDSRYGCYAKSLPSILLTHQLFLKAPLFSKLAQRINQKVVNSFQEVWLPDFVDQEKSLAGDLSHGKAYHPVVKFIGPLSRLQKVSAAGLRHDVLFLLSGPEPQQSLFAQKCFRIAEKHDHLKFACVTPGQKEIHLANLDVFEDPSVDLLAQLIMGSNLVLCRSGYSSLMDMYELGKQKLLLVPTPGQTEQEYLATYWRDKFSARLCLQKDLDKLSLEGIKA